MNVAYVVDTDWVIHYLNGHTGIIEKLGSVRKEGLGISVVSLAELYEGVYYSTNPDASLFTNNRRHFQAVKGLKILSIS